LAAAIRLDKSAGRLGEDVRDARRQASPERVAKGLANHPIGIVLVARLAVDRTLQGRGLGKALLFDALTRIADAAEIVSVRPVLVHAIDEAARRFYEHF